MQQGAQFDDRIRNLIALAQEGSTKGRTLLFSHICDLFLQHRDLHSETQTRMLVEILNELLTKVDVSVKQEIAELLSTMPAPPEELVHLLIEDDVLVSAILLEKAIISDEHLIYLIRYGNDDHRHHLSKRFGMSPLVRNELEKALEASREDKKKYNLSELDKNAEPEFEAIDEETTASLLEIIRAQKLHDDTDPQDRPKKDNTISFLQAEAKQRQQKKKFSSVSTAETKNTPHVSTDILELTEPINENELLLSETAPRKNQQQDISPHKTPADNVESRTGEDPETKHEGALASESQLEMSNVQSDIVHDLSETSHKAHEENNRNNDFIRSAADWFWEMDHLYKMIFLSEEAFIAFGVPAQSLIGAEFIDYCQAQDTDTSTTSFEYIFEQRRSFRDHPFLISSSTGEQTLWHLSGIAVFDTHSGKFKGFRGSARSKSMEKTEIQATPAPEKRENSPSKPVSSLTDSEPPSALEESMEGSKEDIAAELLQNLSHEFRTPLNAIIGFSEMIDMEAWGPVNEQYHNHTRNILEAAGHLKEAVNDVLDSAKLDSGLMDVTPESFSLKTVIKNSLENILPLAQSHGVTVDSGDNNIDVILYNDKQSVELCLTKMLASSIKRAHKHNIIRLAVMVSSKAEVRIEIPLLGEKIPEKNASSLFEKIQKIPKREDSEGSEEKKFNAKISSTFGLSIAKKLANLIGGDIITHSVKGLVTHLALTITNHPHQD